MDNSKVTIIGAGPCGLSVAYFLIKTGIDFQLYERNKTTGGLGGSIQLWGRSLDIGPHIFLAGSKKEAVETWKDLAGTDLMISSLSRGMILNKQLIPFPPTSFNILKSIPFRDTLSAGLGVLKARLYPIKPLKHAGDFFHNRSGTYFRQRIFNIYCLKYMGLPDSQVDLQFALNLISLVKHSGKTDVATTGTHINQLLYPRLGTAMIWNRMAGKIEEIKKIDKGKAMQKVSTKGNRIEKITFDDGTETDVKFLVSTLPITKFVLLMDSVPSDILDACNELNYRNTLLVYLKMKGNAFKYHYISIFDNSIEAGRITNFNNWTDEPNRSDETVLCVEYWLDSHDKNWNMTQNEIIQKTIAQLETIHLLDANQVTDAFVLKIQGSHPVLSTSYKSALLKINQFLSGFENLILAGRHASFVWDGQADNIIAGMEISSKIKDYFKR
ncbi:MAG: FAD-dependent oxidoreductase [Sediminibacterium sp.]|nr:FAD-dependent oxidoreductase [Sediminibacterium sp.]